MTNSPEPSPVRRFFGALLMVVGGLIAALSGLCSLIFLISMITSVVASLGRGSGTTEMGLGLGMVLVVGGLPLALGLGLFFWGRALRREPPRPTLPQANFDRLD